MKMNSIGLDATKSQTLVNDLNVLLANYHMFYQNVRGFHWNIKGQKFFELHVKFEEIYTDALLKTDEIAERILTLEGTPLHSFAAFQQHSAIRAAENITDGIKMVGIILTDMKTLIMNERDVLRVADDAGDEGTSSLISDYVQQQEKTIWMLRSYLA